MPVIIDPGNPKAGKGGVIPPFPPFDGKAGPGRPKGSHSARAALQRRLRRGYQDDAEAEDEAERIGIEARRIANEITEAALAGDGEKVRALCALIAEAEGKPHEKIEHSGSTARTLIVRSADTQHVALPEASE